MSDIRVEYCILYLPFSSEFTFRSCVSWIVTVLTLFKVGFCGFVFSCGEWLCHFLMTDLRMFHIRNGCIWLFIGTWRSIRGRGELGLPSLQYFWPTCRTLGGIWVSCFLSFLTSILSAHSGLQSIQWIPLFCSEGAFLSYPVLWVT